MTLGLFNAFIILNTCVVGAYETGFKNISSRLHLKNSIGRWLFGKIFFDVDPYLTGDALVALKYAINYMNSLTCVKWIQRHPWDDDVHNFVTFFRFKDSKTKPFCGSRFQMVGGKQIIYVGDWCLAVRDDLKRKTTLLHEMMHAMGFLHELQRPDRDCFLHINDLYASLANYAKLNGDQFEYDAPYDYQSVMQYESNSYEYMYSLDYNKLGRRDGKLSRMDIIKVNHVYCGELSYCELYPKECEDYKRLKARYGCVD